jgi:hypothetical protein
MPASRICRLRRLATLSVSAVLGAGLLVGCAGMILAPTDGASDASAARADGADVRATGPSGEDSGGRDAVPIPEAGPNDASAGCHLAGGVAPEPWLELAGASPPLFKSHVAVLGFSV